MACRILGGCPVHHAPKEEKLGLCYCPEGTTHISPLGSLAKCPNTPKGEGEEVFRVLPAYHTVSKERKLDALHTLKKWVEDEIGKNEDECEWCGMKPLYHGYNINCPKPKEEGESFLADPKLKPAMFSQEGEKKCGVCCKLSGRFCPCHQEKECCEKCYFENPRVMEGGGSAECSNQDCICHSPKQEKECGRCGAISPENHKYPCVAKKNPYVVEGDHSIKFPQDSTWEEKNWHIIVGGNGMCECGTEKGKCGDQLANLLSKEREKGYEDGQKRAFGVDRKRVYNEALAEVREMCEKMYRYKWRNEYDGNDLESANAYYSLSAEYWAEIIRYEQGYDSALNDLLSSLQEKK